MTNKFYSAVLAGTAVLAVTLGAGSANAATDSAEATARIVSALTITQGTNLDFARIVPAASALAVGVDTSGARTCAVGLTCSGTTTAASFTVTNGTGGLLVNIATDSSTTLDDVGAGVAMPVTGIAPSVTSATLSGAGSTTFTVGGTLTVGANQVAGVYNGTFNVNVNYN